MRNDAVPAGAAAIKKYKVPAYWEELIAWRLHKKITQAQMATYLSVSRSTYQKWEYGQRNPGRPNMEILMSLLHGQDIQMMIKGCKDMDKQYRLTPEQVEELAEKLPSHTKGQKKEIKRMIAGIRQLEDGETLVVQETVAQGVAHMDLFIMSREKTARILCADIAAAVTRKYLEKRNIPCMAA